MMTTRRMHQKVWRRGGDYCNIAYAKDDVIYEQLLKRGLTFKCAEIEDGRIVECRWQHHPAAVAGDFTSKKRNQFRLN